jgi:hypothetical protein
MPKKPFQNKKLEKIPTTENLLLNCLSMKMNYEPFLKNLKYKELE